MMNQEVKIIFSNTFAVEYILQDVVSIFRITSCNFLYKKHLNRIFSSKSLFPDVRTLQRKSILRENISEAIGLPDLLTRKKG